MDSLMTRIATNVTLSTISEANATWVGMNQTKIDALEA
jgi:hypothetical protein